MYTQKIQNLIVSSLKKKYPNINIQSLSKDGLLVQKSPDSIDSDYGSSIALRLAKFEKTSPMDIADVLCKYLTDTKPDFIDEIMSLRACLCARFLAFTASFSHFTGFFMILCIGSSMSFVCCCVFLRFYTHNDFVTKSLGDYKTQSDLSSWVRTP